VSQGVAGCCRVLYERVTSLTSSDVILVAGCCRVLQGVAGCCRVLQGVAGCCSVSYGRVTSLISSDVHES